jgi:hypothetical protein
LDNVISPLGRKYIENRELIGLYGLAMFAEENTDVRCLTMMIASTAHLTTINTIKEQ